MKNIVKLIVGCAAAAGMVLPASAAISLSLSPASPTVGLGGTATYTLAISGLGLSPQYLGPALGAFNIVLDYNSAIASPVSASFGSLLNVDAGGDFQYSDLGVTTPGQIVLGDISFGSASALEAAQAAGKATGKGFPTFTLATFTLRGLAYGTSALTFDSSSSLSDENGFTLDLSNPTTGLFNGNGGSITVVPETTTTLAGLGAVALVLGVFVQSRKLTHASRS